MEIQQTNAGFCSKSQKLLQILQFKSGIKRFLGWSCRRMTETNIPNCTFLTFGTMTDFELVLRT